MISDTVSPHLSNCSNLCPSVHEYAAMCPCISTSYLLCIHVLKGNYLFFLFLFLNLYPFRSHTYSKSRSTPEWVPSSSRAICEHLKVQYLDGALKVSICLLVLQTVSWIPKVKFTWEKQLMSEKCLNWIEIDAMMTYSQLRNVCLVNIFPISCSSPTEIYLQTCLLNVVKCLVYLQYHILPLGRGEGSPFIVTVSFIASHI